MSSRRSNQRRPARRPSNSTGFDGRSDRASRDGAYTRRDSFDPSAYGRSSDSSRTPSPRSTRDDDNPYTRRVSQAEYTQRRKRAKRKRIALVAVAVVLVLCLGGAGAAFAYYQTV